MEAFWAPGWAAGRQETQVGSAAPLKNLSRDKERGRKWRRNSGGIGGCRVVLETGCTSMAMGTCMIVEIEEAKRIHY